MPLPIEPHRSFLSHAKLVSAITFASRLLGMARESVAAAFFGAGTVWSAFVFAFTIPNLFRKLFGEGALSAAFIPVYAQTLRDGEPVEEPARFAAASVNLLSLTLLAITLLGEAVLLAVWLSFDLAPADRLAVGLTMVMLPYAAFICTAAFLGGILQVHGRFGVFAATSLILNGCLIVAIAVGAAGLDFSTPDGQTRGVYLLAGSVLLAGVAQVVALLPGLRQTPVRLRWDVPLTTPAVRRVLWLSLPVAAGAGVLQTSVLLDRALSFFLAGSDGVTHFAILGQTIRYPLAEGAAARLNWAQFLYQFPLGVFAIALATAIFPRLSREAADPDPAAFRRTLREGVEAALFIGLPASVGLALVAHPAVRVLFEHGRFTPSDTDWTARSTALYASAVWAFSLQQILNRAYYALHDATTPLLWAVGNLLLNVIVEVPLLWTPLAESGMAAGTLVAFSIQAAVMLVQLDRRVGGIGLHAAMGQVARMTIAAGAMGVVLWAVRRVPGWPSGETTLSASATLGLSVSLGALVYFGLCRTLRVGAFDVLFPRRRRAGG